MNVAIFIFIVVYTISLMVLIRFGLVKQFRKERNYSTDAKKIEASEITVLVPFRNEENRFDGLIKSINASSVNPKEFIFINDHSEDQSSQVLKDSLNIENYTILDLPEGVTGKKKAIRFAAEQINSEYTLTMDADVEFGSNYFEKFSELGTSDMYVLPVIMKSKRWFEHFFEMDLLLVTAANSGLAGLSRPIMASGANLLYKTETFNRVDNVQSHVHMASGDDTYLLRDFREGNTDVRLHTDPSIAITTETPQSFKEFISQRLRWIGKTGDIKDSLSTILAIIQAVLTLGFFGMLIWTIIEQDYLSLVKLFGAKAFVDFIVFSVYFLRLGRGVVLWFIPIYEILFPIYTLLLIVLLFTYKPKWKGREIYN